jgi:anaerobic ribonucleoside-triphosphate reductase activating protein
MASDTPLMIAATHPACRTLGPGERFVIWVHGCPLSCPGCISQWIPAGGERVTVEELAARVVAQATDGLTLSGGEPFAQADGLARLVARVRRDRDLSVMCYTGFTAEHLRRHGGPAAWSLLAQLDVLIDGPYLPGKHADLRWRASTNQRVHFLTPRHRDDLHPDRSAGLQIEVTESGHVQWLGVPPVPSRLRPGNSCLGG